MTPAEWFAGFGGKCCKCGKPIADVSVPACPICGSLETQYHAGRALSLSLAPRPTLAPTAPGLAALPDAARTTPRELVLTCAKDVHPEDVEWVWEGWLPKGKLIVLDGSPGVGKTTIVLDLIARATRGAAMPGTDTCTDPITVLIAGAEDGWADTIRPRLDAAAADLHNVHFVTVTNDGTFTIPDDVHRLEAAILKVGAGWVHIDSIMGTLAEDVRTNSDHDVRRALGSLKNMAERLDALITFIRHPKKAGANAAVDAGGGSTGFSAIARGVLFCGYDPTDLTEDMNARGRVFASGKSSLSRLPDSRSFTLVSAPNGRPAVAWGGVSPVTADDLASAPMRQRMGGTVSDGGATKKAAAEQWLEDALKGGVRPTVDALKAKARQCGLSWRTVERAAGDLGVTKQRGKVSECSSWYLPIVPPSVPPSPPITETVGATVDTPPATLFPVPPSVPPSGATGATAVPAGFAPRPATVTPSLSIQGSVGATGGGTADDDGYWQSLEADGATLEPFEDAA